MSLLRSAVIASVLLALLVAPVHADHAGFPGHARPATVTGHGWSFPGRTEPDTWGPDCRAIYPEDMPGHVLDFRIAYAYAAVVDERIEGPNAITLFGEPEPGTFVWTDSNGNAQYDTEEFELAAKAVILCLSVPAPVMPATDTGARTSSSHAPLVPLTLLMLVVALVTDRARRTSGAA
jgi:hypothetical protein